MRPQNFALGLASLSLSSRLLLEGSASSTGSGERLQVLGCIRVRLILFCLIQHDLVKILRSGSPGRLLHQAMLGEALNPERSQVFDISTAFVRRYSASGRPWFLFHSDRG